LIACKGCVSAIVFGLVGALGFAPCNLFACTVASLVWLYCQIKIARKTGAVLKVTFCWLFALYIGTMYWIVVPLTINNGEFVWLIPFAVTLVPAFLAMFHCSFIALSHFLCAGKTRVFLIAFPTFWCFGEVAVTYLPILGFPWNLMGYVWGGFSIYAIQSASLFGVYGLSALLVAISTLLGEAVLTRRSRYKILFVSLAGTIAALNFLYGFIRLYKAGDVQFTNIKIAIVQNNISQELKWRGDQLYINLKSYVDSANALPENVDVVIWPESAVPFSFRPDRVIGKYIAALTMNKRLIITGGVRYSPRQNDLYNSAFTITPSGDVSSYYDKQILLPFGEYVPFRRIVPIKKITDGTEDYSPGKACRSNLKAGKVIFIPKICSEIIFPVADNVGASAILNIANDGWFGKTSEPYQHLEIARMRGVELSIPLIRLSNTGISAVFDSYGREIARIEHGKTEIKIFLLPKRARN
jgi:apolipoprotein N-acyltransferase